MIFTLFELTDQECYKYVQNYITSKDIATLLPTQASAETSEPIPSSKASGAKDTDNHSHLEPMIM